MCDSSCGRRHLAFDNDFRSCRDGETGNRRAYDFQRRATQRAGVFVLADAGLGCGRRSHPGGRLAAENNGHRARFSGLPIFPRDLLAVFVFDDPQCHTVFGDDTGAIGADVDPAGVRIFDDHHVARADITAAVVLVPFGRRKDVEIDAVAVEYIFRDRSGRDFYWNEWLEIANFIAPGFENLQLRRVIRQIEGQRKAARRGEHIGGDAKTFRIAWNVIE